MLYLISGIVGCVAEFTLRLLIVRITSRLYTLFCVINTLCQLAEVVSHSVFLFTLLTFVMLEVTHEQQVGSMAGWRQNFQA